MTSAGWVFLVVAAVAASANWWSRWTSHRATELWSKPLTLVALIGAAVAIEPGDPDVRVWFVIALVLSLAGDVFLLGDDRWFVAGLGAFLAAHLAYVVGFVAADEWRWWAFCVAVALLTVVAGTIGRRIVAGAAGQRSSLWAPVVAYLVVISSMTAVAAAAGNRWAIVGALAFLASDSILGWRQFVSGPDRHRWMPLAIMVTYHVAQASLVVSLR